MGKHLAPKKKHELNFIKRIPKRAIGPERAAHVLREETDETPEAGAHTVRERSDGAPARAAHAIREESGQKPEKAAGPKLRMPAMRMPALGRHPWIFYVLAVILLVVIRFLPLEGWKVPAAYAIPALLCLPEHVLKAWERFRRGDRLNGNLIACLAAVLLFLTGMYLEAVLLLILTFVIGFAEKLLLDRSNAEHNTLSQLLPGAVQMVTEEGTERVDPAAVQPGDIILIPAGERIPLDGVVAEGITTIDTAAVSGQRSPWAVNVGYKVYAGCRNLTSDIKVRVSRPSEQSTASKIVRVSENAPGFVSEQESFAQRFSRIYTPVVLGLALLVGVIIPAFRGGWIVHAQRAAVLLIASYCVPELFCIPLLYGRALSKTEKMGVFAKGKDCLEAMAKADTLIFDKTGTITEGRYSVTDVYPVKMSEKQLLAIAAAAECFSRHPIAFAIREASGRLDERALKSVRLREIPGRGVSSLVGNRQVLVGNAALLEEHGVKYNIPSRPGTAIHVSVDGRYCGHILVADKVRRRAFDALETLRVNGVKKLVLLTGDVLSVARPIASRLNFDMLRAELRPSEKAKAVGYLMKNKGSRTTIAFVGEGENSGKILTGADVGIAMGSLGSDQAFACADMMIMDRDIFKIPKTLVISRVAYRAAWENFAAGAGVNVLLVLLGALGVVTPLAAEIVSFFVCAAMLGNTLRLK